MAFDDQRAKAFDVAVEGAKQLIALATGVIAFTVTFAKDFLHGAPHELKVGAAIAWGFYVFSILGGLLSIYGLLGQLDPEPPKAGSAQAPNTGQANSTPVAPVAPAAPHSASTWMGAARLGMMVQQVCFIFGLIATVASGLMALF